MLLTRLETYSKNTALIWRDQIIIYDKLIQRIQEYREQLQELAIAQQIVALHADHSPAAIAWLLALWLENNVVALLSSQSSGQFEKLVALSEANYLLTINIDDHGIFRARGKVTKHPLLQKLCHSKKPGFIIFSSGSTGCCKAAVHGVEPFLARHQLPKRQLRTLAFLLFDHIGGLNTVFYTLASGGTVVIPENRRPLTIAKIIQRHRVQAITTSPTFLNLLLLSGACDRFDLNSLDIINYGTEPMPLTTLTALHARLPYIRLSQAYGLSETGIIPTRSRSSDSLWMKVGDDSCPVRVRSGLLEVKSTTSMLGYLNAETPWTADGWFKTGDAVIQEGEYMRILGRQSDLINVGGEKVYPAEIENILKTMQNVIDVAITAQPHPLIGQLIIGKFQLENPETLTVFKSKLQTFCTGKLASFQIPRKILLTQTALHNERYKKIRTLEEAVI